MEMNKTVILISSIDWDDNYQMHHQLTESFVSQDYNVLFIENTGVRSLKFNDIKRIFSRLFNWLKYSRGFKKKSNLINILSPLVIPFPFSRVAIFLNTLILKKSINNYLSFKKINDFVLITFLPSPLVVNLINKIKPNQLYYYCANDMVSGSLYKNKITNSEKIILKKSNAVFTISTNLYNKAKEINQNVFSLPPGVDFKKFNRVYKNKNYSSFLNDINEPIIGYIGSISKVFDFDLIKKIIKNFDNCKIVIIGKVYENNPKLRSIISSKNVIFINQVDHSELPKYVKYFKVGLIPYIINEFTNSVSACKLNEYLSLGVPIVSTSTKEILNFNKLNNDIIFTDSNNNNLISIIDNIIYDKINIDRDLYQQISKGNDWSLRFNIILNLIDDNTKKEEFNDWNIEFSKSVKYFWNKIFKFSFVFIFFLLIVFKSPLFWLIGNALVVQQEPFKSSAIVIFSGTGNIGYENIGYQKRALEAVKLYKQGFAEKIILTSGRMQNISEGEMISSFLISKGLEKNSFILLDQYPSSTYENVKIVSDHLKKNNIYDIILLTAPYHTKRSKLIWDNVSSDIKVNFPPSIDYNKNKIKWSFKLSEIRIIIYEVFAIIYNKYKNYL